MKEILEEIEEFAYASESWIEYEDLSDLLKLKLSDTIKKRYPGMYTKFNKTEKSFKVYKGNNYMPPHEHVTSIQDEVLEYDEEETKGSSNNEERLSLYHLEKVNTRDVITWYRNKMGFSLVVEEMINWNKPLIGHNCIYDICFFYDQFIGRLPGTFMEFNKKWRECFPLTYDTKFICLKYHGKLFHTTQLSALYKKCRKDKSMRKMVSYSIDEAPMYKKYQNEEDTLVNSIKFTYAHEAGFDAYMAGWVFLSTAKYREIGYAIECQKAVKAEGNSRKLPDKRKKKKREMKAEDKDTGCNSQGSTGNGHNFWEGIRGEKIELGPMLEFSNKIVLDLNNRYFDFSEEFDGKERNFDTSSVIWVRWCKRKLLTSEQENWSKNKIEYERERHDIVVSQLADILTHYGDVSIVKDSPVSAFVEFTSFDPKDFKRTANKGNVFKNESVLKEICRRLKSGTSIDSFEVLPYEMAEKFSAKFVHE